MNLRHTSATQAEPKVLKVQLPVQYHIKLRTIKVLTGRTMSDVVESALVDYFDAIQRSQTASDGASPIEDAPTGGRAW